MLELEGQPCRAADSRLHPHPELTGRVKPASLVWGVCWGPLPGGPAHHQRPGQEYPHLAIVRFPWVSTGRLGRCELWPDPD